MGVTGRINMGKVHARIARRREEIMDEVMVEAEAAGVRGERQFEDMLFEAETPTGHRRVESGAGAFAGRIRSGELIESTGHKVSRSGERITIGYGAINNRPEYAEAQLYGDDAQNIPPAISELEPSRDVNGIGKDQNIRLLLEGIRRVAAMKWRARA